MTTIFKSNQATLADQDRAVATLLTAFASDPAARWIYPDAEAYFTFFPEFLRAFGGSAFHDETAEMLENGRGVAVWLSPQGQPDEEKLIELLQRSVPEERLPGLFSMLEEMGSYHPSEPHWYLPLIGVNPVSQAKGFGSTLMRKTLARCDREHLPAYLESSNPRNVPFYERFGFRSVGRIQREDSPPILPMVRDAR